MELAAGTAEVAVGKQARKLEAIAQLAAQRRRRSFARRERRQHLPSLLRPRARNVA
jgi:hypothetical protein